MIKITMFQDQSEILGYIVQGHADYDEAGQDIVCAAVSVLAQTALLGLEQFLPDQYLWEIQQDGYMECRLGEHLTQEEAHDAQVILMTMLRGFESIQAQYGDYIEITLQEVK